MHATYTRPSILLSVMLAALCGQVGAALASDGIAITEIALPSTPFVRPAVNVWQPAVLPPSLPMTNSASNGNLSAEVVGLPAPGASLQTVSTSMPVRMSDPSFAPAIMPPVGAVTPSQVAQQPNPASFSQTTISRPASMIAMQPTLTPVGLSSGAGGSGGIGPVITWPPPWPPAGQSQVFLPPAAINGLPALASREQLGLSAQ